MQKTPNKFTGPMTKVGGRAVAVMIAALCSLHAVEASAATISLGSQIALGSDLLVVPVTITDAADVTGWAFDLRYDPLDLQINSACDPFSGDVYCSLFTGPVTEGDFFASGSPFNVLNPGFVDLDPATLEQTGLLFAVNGTFGGSASGASGEGVLAYVEFLRVGRGTNVTLENPTVTSVPEPGTLALFATGLMLFVGRRRQRRASLVGALALVALVMSSVNAAAQTTAPGPYLATPAWDQQIKCDTLATCQRFVVLSNWNNDAVLDRETGLVWERAPNRPASQTWNLALFQCVFQDTGGRFGWRLPTIQELLSLAVPDASGQPHLPLGHPFVLASENGYWSATSGGFPPSAGTLSTAWGVDFNGFFLGFLKNGNGGKLDTWCVRGGSGLDGQ